MKNVYIVDHPFIIDSLAHLRDKETDLKKFRFYSDQLCRLMFADAIRGLSFRDVEIETPLERMTAQKLADEIVIAPVLRAGLAMLPSALQFLPKSKVGFVGLARDEKTAIASEYYWKFPEVDHTSVVMITDPMLATGGSSLHVLQKVMELKPKEVRIVCVIAAPEGIATVHEKFPSVKIFTAAVDDHLNDKKYIVPGIGDYGDRYFGTT